MRADRVVDSLIDVSVRAQELALVRQAVSGLDTAEHALLAAVRGPDITGSEVAFAASCMEVANHAVRGVRQNRLGIQNPVARMLHARSTENWDAVLAVSRTGTSPFLSDAWARQVTDVAAGFHTQADEMQVLADGLSARLRLQLSDSLDTLTDEDLRAVSHHAMRA